MDSLGLSSGDSDLPDRHGRGRYADSAFDERPNGDFCASTEGKRAALPVIYKGPFTG